MRNALAILAVLPLFGGCVVYDKELVYDTGDDTGRQQGGGRDTNGGGGDTDPQQRVHLWLDPAGAVVGDTAILSLRTDSEGVDLTHVADVKFFGAANVGVLATDTRSANEYLLTIQVPQGAPTGSNDLLVEFDDGTAAYVAGGFAVVTDASQIPASQGGGDCN